MSETNKVREVTMTFREEDLNLISEALYYSICDEEDAGEGAREDWMRVRDRIEREIARNDGENKYLSVISGIQRDLDEIMTPLIECLKRQLLAEVDAADVRKSIDGMDKLQRFINSLLK